MRDEPKPASAGKAILEARDHIRRALRLVGLVVVDKFAGDDEDIGVPTYERLRDLLSGLIQIRDVMDDAAWDFDPANAD